ncbi:Calx-beta domain-containing protein [Aegicerativicinus sediminis]|uniref:Calx-beta domain-containing protein n=1 Tax=Aegicerativicinus sediminis TaxID=2893202 RepID=UPI001E33803E|nr:Calx-beta domain-containing protein [Aegicerativicinus sediminis]
MKLRSLLFLGIITLFLGCEEDDNNATGTAAVSFAYDNLREVEGATIPLSLNLGIDNYAHSGGSVTIDISGGNYGTDYETSEGSSSFNIDLEPNQLTASFTIQPIDDEVIEDDKVLTISISAVTGSLTLGEKTSFTLTLLDDDDPTIASIEFENATFEIDENSTTPLILNLIFDQATTDGGSITIGLAGEAVLDTDYSITGASGNSLVLSVPGGATSASFEIATIDNSEYEPNKTIELSIEEVSGGLSVGVGNSSTVTIINDDAAPNPIANFAIASTTVDEDNGTLSATINFSSTTIADATLEISASGTATLGSDYTYNSSSISPVSINIPSGSDSISFDIDITDDSDTEEDETIILDLTSVTGGLEIGNTTSQFTITITDNDQVSLFSYQESFETVTADISEVGYQNIFINQTLPEGNLIKYLNRADTFPDINDPSQLTANGLQIFYNISSDGEGVIDNMIVSPVLEATGNMKVSYDVSYVTGKAKNIADVTFYWSKSYDGSGSFDESQWTALETVTATSLDAEGVARTGWSRREFNITATSNFYLAIRINQSMTASNDVLQWRWDNIQAIQQ